MKIILIVSVVIFVVLLVYYITCKEGYDLQQLNIGKWKMNGTGDKLSVEGEEGKEVLFNSTVSVKKLKIGNYIISENDGALVFNKAGKPMPSIVLQDDDIVFVNKGVKIAARATGQADMILQTDPNGNKNSFGACFGGYDKDCTWLSYNAW